MDIKHLKLRIFESLFGHIARYVPSQTFKNTLPIAHKSLFQNY